MESNARAESVARQRIRYAGFPSIKTITDFDFTAKPAVDRVQIAGLEGGGWLAEARNIVLLARRAPAKTHLATALEIAAAHAGHRALRSHLPPGGSPAWPKRIASTVLTPNCARSPATV